MLTTAISLTKIIGSLEHRQEVLFALAGELARVGRTADAEAVLDGAARVLLLADHQRSRLAESLGGWAIKKTSGQLGVGWMTLDMAEELDRVRNGSRWSELHGRFCGPQRAFDHFERLDSAQTSPVTQREIETLVRDGRMKLLDAARWLAQIHTAALRGGHCESALPSLTLLCSVYDEMTWEREDDPSLAELIGICLASFVLAFDRR